MSSALEKPEPPCRRHANDREMVPPMDRFSDGIRAGAEEVVTGGGSSTANERAARRLGFVEERPFGHRDVARTLG